MIAINSESMDSVDPTNTERKRERERERERERAEANTSSNTIPLYQTYNNFIIKVGASMNHNRRTRKQMIATSTPPPCLLRPTCNI